MTSGGPKPAGYRVRSRTRSYFAEVLRADTTFIPDKNKVVEYEMSNGREFFAYSTRGAYDGTYPHPGPGPEPEADGLLLSEGGKLLLVNEDDVLLLES